MLPRPTTLEDWGRIFTDLSIWTPVVREICVREGLACVNVNAGFPGSNAVFQVDDKYVVKIFAPMFDKDYARELAAYTFARSAQLTIPALVAYGSYDDGNSWSYLITTFCPGEAIREVRDQLSETNLNQIASHLGEMVRRMHMLQLNKGLPGWVPLTWDSYFGQQKSKAIDAVRKRELFEPDLVSDITQLLEQAEHHFIAPNLSFVHGDLTEDHLLLVDGEEGSVISALIDFADAEIAPVEYEWVALWFVLLGQNAPVFRNFMWAYDPGLIMDAAWQEKMLAMTFLHRYGVGIVAHALSQCPVRPKLLSELKETLWPGSLLRL